LAFFSANSMLKTGCFKIGERMVKQRLLCFFRERKEKKMWGFRLRLE
jgi:hypothetical protein